MRDLLHALLALPIEAPLPGEISLAAWWDRRRDLRSRWLVPIDRAIVSGFAADRLGFAFAGGYQAALSALFPSIGADGFAALCATEEGGAHPRAIRTSLTKRADGEGLILEGKKRWATMASRADELFIVASIGADEEGKNRLRLARIRADRPGVRVVLMPDPPFAPEIPHAQVELSGVLVSEEDLLPGDGYEAYLKPFRTVEDVHVHGALLGYLVGVARRHGWPTAVMDRLTAMVVCARSLGSPGEAPPSSPEVHVAVGGMLAETRRLLEDTAGLWAKVGEAERARWDRDRPLLEVAGKARAARLTKAWERLSLEAGSV